MCMPQFTTSDIKSRVVVSYGSSLPGMKASEYVRGLCLWGASHLMLFNQWSFLRPSILLQLTLCNAYASFYHSWHHTLWWMLQSASTYVIWSMIISLFVYFTTADMMSCLTLPQLTKNWLLNLKSASASAWRVSHVWHDSFVYATWLICNWYMTHVYVTWLLLSDERQSLRSWASHVWHCSFS